MPHSAEADIQLVGTTTASGTSVAYNMSLTSLQGGIASQPAEGDIVIVTNVLANTSNGNPGVGTAGYTEMADLYANNSSDTNFSVSYKVMTASPDTTVSCNPSSGSTISSTCHAVVFRGVNASSPMDVASTTATAVGSEDINCPSITPVTVGAVVVCLGGAAGSAVPSGTFTWPTGYTQATKISSDPGSASLGVGAYKSWSGSGAEDPAAFVITMGTSAFDSWAALTLALRPILPPPVLPARIMRLFEGYKIKLIGKKIIVY